MALYAILFHVSRHCFVNRLLSINAPYKPFDARNFCFSSNGFLQNMFFTPSTDCFVVVSQHEISIYSHEDLGLISKYRTEDLISETCNSLDGKHITIALSNGEIYTFNIFTQELIGPGYLVPGVFVNDVNFNIANFVELTEKQKIILKQHGAILEYPDPRS